MSNDFTIQSHKGPYSVHFDPDAFAGLNAAPPADTHVIIDERVADLYADQLSNVLALPSVLRIKAEEPAKSLERFPAYVEHLAAHGLRRDHILTAVGGGIIQDITCFLAATMLRGVAWHFYPTTLLAQCDSCIGSKSSINCGDAKNILGTFTPPNQVVIAAPLLRSLDERDLRSGIGEMLKVHAIAGPDVLADFAERYDDLFTDDAAMERAVADSLRIKKGYIETDEFDRGPRLVFNLGHSFGHAVEAATDFAVPHGIAVTIGLDMANWMSARLGLGQESHWTRFHGVLAKNYRGFESHKVPLDRFLAALAKDKKNTGSGSATLILPDAQGCIIRDSYRVDESFRDLCRIYLEQMR